MALLASIRGPFGTTRRLLDSPGLPQDGSTSAVVRCRHTRNLAAWTVVEKHHQRQEPQTGDDDAELHSTDAGQLQSLD